MPEDNDELRTCTFNFVLKKSRKKKKEKRRKKKNLLRKRGKNCKKFKLYSERYPMMNYSWV